MDIEIPGYTLIQALGKGGMATVFLAKQDVLERKVALKVMSRNLADDPSFGERFMREAKIVSQLVHPNIVTVHEVGQHNGHYYLSMEYIDGHDLRSVRKKLDIRGCIRVIEDIARALHYAGEKGYVHRDIKPENIMFRTMDGSAVLTDFGIARAVKTDLAMTQAGTAIGTPHYMSPEQAKGKAVDHRSDLYSLGVVFYLLLTGRVPYDAETAVAIGIKHITEPTPTLPESLLGLQSVLDGLMAKDPENRYQDGLALLNDMRQLDLDEITDVVSAMEGHPTQISDIASSVPDTDGDGSRRFTIEYSLKDAVDEPPKTILPTFVAISFVLISLLSVIYIARPSALESFILEVEKGGTSLYEKAKGVIDKGIDQSTQYIEEKAEPSRANAPAAENQKEVISAPNIVSTDASSAVNSVKGTDTRREQQDDLEPAPSIAEAVEQNTVADEPSSVSSLPVVVSSSERVVVSNSERVDGERVADKSPSTRPERVVENEPASVFTEPQEAEPDLPAPALADLKAALLLLQAESERDSSIVPQFIEAHRALLKYYPHDEETLTSFNNIKETRRAMLLGLADLGEVDRVDKQLKIYQYLFPDEQQREWQSLSDEAHRRLDVHTLTLLAEQQLKAGKVVLPDSDNALESYLRILALDEQNSVAIVALKNISSEFELRADKALKKKQYQEALYESTISLTAYPENTAAKLLKLEVEQALRHKEQIEQALDSARQFSDLGHLYQPEGGNAFDQYQQVLVLDPENIDAKEGLSTLIDLLSVKVWELVGNEKFDAAKSMLVRPLEVMPVNERIKAMLTAVEEVSQR